MVVGLWLGELARGSQEVLVVQVRRGKGAKVVFSDSGGHAAGERDLEVELGDAGPETAPHFRVEDGDAVHFGRVAVEAHHHRAFRELPARQPQSLRSDGNGLLGEKQERLRLHHRDFESPLITEPTDPRLDQVAADGRDEFLQ